MQKKILIAIIIVLMGAGIIYYFYNNDSKLPSKNKYSENLNSEPVKIKYGKNTDQKWQEEICKNLSEDECKNNNNCLGKYDLGPCTTGIPAHCVENFNSCGPSGFNPEEIQQIKIECDKINGEFKIGEIGPYCICNLGDQNRCLEDLISQLRNN